MEGRRKLLIVSYWYPPAIGAAAERIASFVRYLPEHGFDVCVLTAERESYPQGCDGVHVEVVQDPLGSGASAFADYKGRQVEGEFRRWWRDLVFPDRFVHWAVAASRRGAALLRDERFDAILATFPPASVFSAALSMHRASNVPLFLDVRDRWLGPGGYEPLGDVARRRHEKLERETFKAASGIVTISDAMADAICAEQGVPRAAVEVVMNGFDDEDDWAADSVAGPKDARADAGSSRAIDGDKLVIAHVGTVIERNRPDLFFESIRRLYERGELSGIQVQFVGNLSSEFIELAGLKGLVTTTGLVEKSRARDAMSSADALLLLTGAYVGHWGYSAKLFEYLRAGRPVLCLEECANSNDLQLLKDVAPARTFSAKLGDDISTLAALRQLRESARPAAMRRGTESISRFSRKCQCQRLAALLQSKLT